LPLTVIFKRVAKQNLDAVFVLYDDIKRSVSTGELPIRPAKRRRQRSRSPERENHSMEQQGAPVRLVQHVLFGADAGINRVNPFDHQQYSIRPFILEPLVCPQRLP
jgi:hypothetical protein